MARNLDGRPPSSSKCGSVRTRRARPSILRLFSGPWEGDNTLVVDTTGLDENTWLTDAGYPHSIDAHVQERFTRTDHNDLELTLTVDDPKFYTKPFSLGTEYFRWVPDQLLDERLCIPSNVIEYLKAVGDPAGKQP